MNGRIAALHVRYRVPSGTSLAATQVPLIDRVLQSRLAETLAVELESSLETGQSVVVIREATARVTLRPSDWSLDHTMVERIGRASRDAVASILARPATADAVIRFANSTEFIGTFLIDLMNGTAWERWYYGAFQRFRRSDIREILDGVLADAETDVLQVFGWLAHRGRLEAVLGLLGPSRSRQHAFESRLAPPGPPARNDLEVLAAAALEILRAAGVPLESLPDRTQLLVQYHAFDPFPPSWADRDSLTGWIESFIAFVLSSYPQAGQALRTTVSDWSQIDQLLAGPLDWLDGRLLKERLIEHRRSPAELPPLLPKTTPSRWLTPRQERMLARLAALVRQGLLRVDPAPARRDEALVRLAAALVAEETEGGQLDRALVVVLERVLVAWGTLEAGKIDLTRFDRMLSGSAPAGETESHPSNLEAAMGPVQEIGPSAVGLLRDLVGGRQPIVEAGEVTDGAGLYLLARAVSDLRLPSLSIAAGVPTAPLLAGLAGKLLGVRPPFDHATALWVGAAEPPFESLNEGALASLQHSLLETLALQRHLDSKVAHHSFQWRGQTFQALSDELGTCWPIATSEEATGAFPELGSAWSQATGVMPEELTSERSPTVDLAELAPLNALAPSVEVMITSIASAILRAWSRWLPGLGGSSLPFLVRNCLKRTGRVGVTEDGIEVQLGPAALDIVLEMAGYFRPLEKVPWLGERSVRFSVARGHR